MGGESSMAYAGRAVQQSSPEAANTVNQISFPTLPHSAVFRVGNVSYIASGHGHPWDNLSHNDILQPDVSNRAVTSLATVIDAGSPGSINADFIRQVHEEHSATDDVFQSDFLQGVIFTTSSSQEESGSSIIDTDAIKLLRSLGNEWISVAYVTEQDTNISPGVFVAHSGALHEVYRLYEDTHGAFVSTFIKAVEGGHVPLQVSPPTPLTDFVAVPSRMKKKSTRSDVLDRLRIAIKDNFHVKGIRNTVCNWAYYNTYDIQNKTAKCVAKLEDGGAYVLGTTKMAAFAATEEPLECIDYQAPWNPRGDGHQSPAGSSSGSGAAAASYEWLDITIGSDTSGSGRRPAHWNGCFALRPTHGSVSVEGFIPSFPLFDTPTLFGRDIYKCRDFFAAWSSEEQPASTLSQAPFKIVVPEDYMLLIKNNDQVKLIEQFVRDLETSLGTKHELISFEKAWDAAPPEKAGNETFAAFMRDASRNSFFYDDYHNLDQFRDDYERKFSKTPYISPPVRWQWNLSKTITRTQRDEAVHRLSVYKDWFSKHIMEDGKKRTIIIIPIENISPRYRDEATTSFNPVGVPNLFLSPILGAPEITVPIGQVPFLSKVSGRTEFLSVGISLLSRSGTDLELFNIAIECLNRSHRPTRVLTGSTMFKN